MFFDPDNPDDAELFSTQFGDLCERLGVTYLYAEEIDLDAQSEKYLAIGFGDDASDIVKEKRHPGVTVEGFLNEAQLKVSSGEEESMVSHQKTMLDVYADFAEKVMAIPVVKGVKSPNERFAGALNTYSIEAMMQDGKALQAGTSHFLGQNFAKSFDVTFLNKENKFSDSSFV